MKLDPRLRGEGALLLGVSPNLIAVTITCKNINTNTGGYFQSFMPQTPRQY
jgi:hypothetical protein